MQYHEITVVTTSEGADAVSNLFLELGAGGTAIEDKSDLDEARLAMQWDYADDDLLSHLNGEAHVKAYFSAADGKFQTRLREELERLRGFGWEMGKLEVRTRIINGEDWAESWKKYYKPIPLGRLVICPVWEAYDAKNGEIVLKMEPGMMFGSGQHETTSMCLQQLQDMVQPGMRVLDVGSGSGILSIASLLLGAKEAVGVDIDPNGVETAYQNGACNGITKDTYTVYAGNVLSDEALIKKIGDGYDLVVANIVADVIIALLPLFGMFLKESGRCIVSGIISERIADVEKALLRNGFAVQSSKRDGEWAAIMAQRA
ncbi:MAG: 50S ribosomal protein L11 methyltransferase [Christensenellales bacterium]